jgi:peptidoglycan/LPS O-acetylase OafA/YrhL
VTTAGLEERTPEAQANNFDLLRLLFAGLVIFSHSFALVGLVEPMPWGRTLGNLAVHGFFVLSGYLVTQSYLRTPTLGHYLGSRALRIGPGLVVAMIATAVVATLSHNFAGNPIPDISNGPVWTLTWEIICYLLLVVLGLTGGLQRTTFPAIFVAFWVVYLANIWNLTNFFLVIAPMFLMFAAGALFAIFLERIATPVVVLAAIGFALTASYAVFEPIQVFVAGTVPFLFGPEGTPEHVFRVLYLVSFPILVIWAGTRTWPGRRLRYDLSYGLYIYGWPVAQSLVFLALRAGFHLPWWELFFATVAVTVPVAYLSWRFVEAPSLRLKRFLRNRSPAPADHPAAR